MISAEKGVGTPQGSARDVGEGGQEITSQRVNRDLLDLYEEDESTLDGWGIQPSLGSQGKSVTVRVRINHTV